MAIIYPLALPTVTGMSQIRISSKPTVAVSESGFTGWQQVQEYSNRQWLAAVSLPSMPRAQAMQWISFLLKLSGRKGTFLMGFPDSTLPKGVATGVPTVNGAHAADVAVLNTKGWTVSVTNILKAGDFIQLGTGATARLYMNLNDANSDVTGLAVLDIWPSLRVAHANNDIIVTSNAQSVFRLSKNIVTWDIAEAVQYGIQFEANEAL